MDTLKKVLHPNSSHTTNDSPSSLSSSGGIPASAHTHPNLETQAALGDQPNITGTDRHPPPGQSSSSSSSSSEVHHHHDEEQQQQQQHKQPRAGHHHPRQPVGATGLPPNHKPRSDFTAASGGGEEDEREQQQQQQQTTTTGVTGAEAGLEGGDVGNMGKVVAESGNNFSGTNPHPTHSALGNKDAEGTQGTLNPGRE